MKTHRTLLATLATLLVAALGLWSCGGVECGPNTTERDGACVPSTDVACGDGTVAEGDRCVLAETSCSTGTEYDAERDKCVPSQESCDGPGVNFEDGQCVAVSSCGNGTEIDEQGICRPKFDCPDDGAVQPDTASGECVIAAGGCGAGAERTAQGNCVVAETGCADGLAFDPDANECIVGEGVCAPGTTISENGTSCVPNSEACGEDAIFDEEMGLCVPEATCKMEDVVYNGLCVSPAEELAAKAEVSESENDDPELGGAPTEFDPREETGKSRNFKGTIGPPVDHDGDGTAEQDRDFFEFTADAGDWYKLTVQSTGLPQPSVLVTGPHGYHRLANNGRSGAPARRIVTPYEGDYRIRIVPDAWEKRDDFGPVGGDDWGYVGSLETLETPSAQTVDLSSSTISGEAAGLDDNLFEVEGFDANQLATLTASSIGSDIDAEVLVWTESGKLVGAFDAEQGDARTILTPDGASGTFQILVDWRRLRGTDDGFEIDGAQLDNSEHLGNLGTDDEQTSTSRDINGTYHYTFTVPDGQIAEITHTSQEAQSATYRLMDAGGAFLEESGNTGPANSNLESAPDPMYRFARGESRYILQVTPSLGTGGLSDLVVTVRTSTPADLGSGAPGDTIQTTVSQTVEAEYTGWAALELTDAARITGSLSSFSPDSSNVEARFETTDHRELAVQSGDSGSVEGFEILRAESGTVLFGVEPGKDTSLTEYTTDFALEQPAVGESEPNDLPVTATQGRSPGQHVGQLGGDDVDYFQIDIQQDQNPNDVLVATLRGDSEDEYSCELVDADGNEIDADTTSPEGCVVFGGELRSGSYFVRITSSADEQTRYVLETETARGTVESTDNDESSQAENFDYANFESGDRVYGDLGEDDKTDWFTFTLPDDAELGADTYMTIDTEMLGPVTNDTNYAKMTFGLYDANENLLAEGFTRRGPAIEGIGVRGLSSGDYFLKVSLTQPEAYDGVPSTKYSFGWDGTHTPSKAEFASPDTTIPDDGTTVTNELPVSGCNTVDRVDVEVDISHAERGDLEIKLTGPGGNEAIVKNAWNNIGFGYTTGTADIKNVFPLAAPTLDSFEVFEGTNGNGAWTLGVTDKNSGNLAGTLNNWRLNLVCQ